LDDSYAASTLVFSARTDAAKAQDLIESKLIKRTKNKMVPDGKKAVFFIDDFNMPRKDAFGTQSSLELIRFFCFFLLNIFYTYFYFIR
jgi:dynein heavy chain